MKLRIKGNSIRLRLMRSELEHLQAGGSLEEVVQFSPDVRLRYTLAVADHDQPVGVSFVANEISTRISTAQLVTWSSEEQVGIYTVLATGLEVAIEKDFACLDRGEDENADAFTHPLHGATC